MSITTEVESENVTFNMECDICFTSLKHSHDGPIVALMPCGHCFHECCLLSEDERPYKFRGETVRCPTCFPSQECTIVRLNDSNSVFEENSEAEEWSEDDDDDDENEWNGEDDLEAMTHVENDLEAMTVEQQVYSHEDALYGPVPSNIHVPTKCMTVTPASSAAPCKKQDRIILPAQFQDMKDQVQRAEKVNAACRLVCHDFRLRHSQLCRRHSKLRNRWWEREEQLDAFRRGRDERDERICRKALQELQDDLQKVQADCEKYYRNVLGWQDTLHLSGRALEDVYTTRQLLPHKRYLQGLKTLQRQHTLYKDQLQAVLDQTQATKKQIQELTRKQKEGIQLGAKLKTQHQTLEERIVAKDEQIQRLEQRLKQLQTALTVVSTQVTTPVKTTSWETAPRRCRRLRRSQRIANTR